MLQKVSGMPKLTDPTLFKQQSFINGEWVDADDKAVFAVNNPSTGAVLGHVPNLTVTEVRRAVEAADAAWGPWRAKTAKERATILNKWFDLLMANQEDLGIIMTAEQGKPLAEAKGEVAYAASFV